MLNFEGGCTIMAIVFAGFLALYAGISLLSAWIIDILWDWILVAEFGWPDLSLWQTWGIIALVGMIFGGCKFSCSTHIR